MLGSSPLPPLDETLLPAASEREAMDWSLVLASQGIESTLHGPAESGQWLVGVAQEDADRAREALHLYELENRNRRWQHEIKPVGLFYEWRSLPWVWVWVLVHWAAAISRWDWTAVGRMDAGAVAEGQWWRLFTAVTLHADVGHLVSNATLGVLLLGLAMGCYGVGPASLAAFLAGVLGNGFNFLVRQPPFFSLGASGMVMGALGLLTANSFQLWRAGQPAKLAARAVFAGVFLLLLFGLNPVSDVAAHVAGFLGGGLAGLLLILLPVRLAKSPAFNRACLAGVILLLAAPWVAALAWQGR